MRSGGFTLLELLVAMAVLGLLTVVLSGSLRFGLRAWETGQRASDALETASTVQPLLRRQIEQAYPLLARTGEPAVVFEGGRQRLRFLTLLPERAGGGGLADVALSYRADAAGGGRLEMAWQPLGERERPAASRTLFDGVDALDFAYYGGERRTGTAEWRETWEDAGFLPALVRLRVRFRDGRAWPDLVAAPAVTVDSLLE